MKPVIVQFEFHLYFISFHFISFHFSFHFYFISFFHFNFISFYFIFILFYLYFISFILFYFNFISFYFILFQFYFIFYFNFILFYFILFYFILFVILFYFFAFRSLFVRQRSLFVRQRSSFVRQCSSFVRQRSSFVRQCSSFVRATAQLIRATVRQRSSFVSSFVRQHSVRSCDSAARSCDSAARSSFVRQHSSFVQQRSSFVRQHSSFVRQRSSFVRQRSSFVRQRSSFVRQRSSVRSCNSAAHSCDSAARSCDSAARSCDSAALSFWAEHEAISTSTFIADIHQLWNECKASQKDEKGVSCYLPMTIHLILAQCYGYKHDIDAEAETVIDVIALTSEDHKKTEYCYKLRRDNVVDSTHFELFDCGRTLRREGDDEHAPMSSNSATGDRSAEHSPIMKLLDFTGLGCLAMCINPSDSATTTPILDPKQHGPLALFNGISKVLFSLSPKNISDYYRARSHNGIIDSIVGPTTNLALAPLVTQASFNHKRPVITKKRQRIGRKTREDVPVKSSQRPSVITKASQHKGCKTYSMADALKSVTMVTNSPLGIHDEAG